MGEAKRRKLTGTYPDGGPVEDFRVPKEKLAITIDVDGADPSTVIFDADKVTDLARAVEAMPGRPAYAVLVRGLAAEFVDCKKRRADLSGTGIGILWSCLYHPHHGERMRGAVSRRLRETGKAHVTWRVSNALGLAIALADQFDGELDNFLEITPTDWIISIGFEHPDDPRPS